MTSTLPDTTGGSPERPATGPRERSAFNLNGQESGEDTSPHSAQGFDRPDQTVFDLTMDYSDDETLLDWEQYAGMRKFKCWGMNCSLVARFCPFMPWVPPEWYYRYSRRQRRLMTMGFTVFGVLLVLLVGATVLLSLLPSQDAPSGLGQANQECAWNSFHLPHNVLPVQYDLELDVDLEEPFLVVGRVQVRANVTNPSRCVVMHAGEGLDISHLNLVEPHTHGTWKYNTDQEQVILQFEEAIRGPSVDFVLHFNYTLSQGLSGFYRSTYKVSSGESRVMGTTQMEANSARKAFPCFDEPQFKAKWNFSMTAPSQEKVLFNTPEASSAAAGSGKARHTFDVTPPMSSYLVAFVVGNLTSVSSTVPYPHGTQADRLISVWGTPDRAENLQTALQVATVILPAYESMFGVPYPLPKLDLVAIPDFSAGAMENWGIITYRETALLFDKNDSSIANERRIALVVAHEMAHMVSDTGRLVVGLSKLNTSRFADSFSCSSWFGDLVTMRDWGELWLNEGFATYFENVGASIARPNFAYFETFFSDFGTSAMATDALPKSTHPLATTSVYKCVMMQCKAGIDTPERVEAMFDDISYDKGGSVLRMLRAYLNRDADPQPLLRRSLLDATAPPQVDPEETFLRGLQRYLQKYSYNNTSSDQLWAEMDGVTGEDVTSWMRTWTHQPGFPRVEVLLDGVLKTDIVVYQAPFEVSGPRPCNGKGTIPNAPWWIPVASITRDGGRTPAWTTFSGCMMEHPIYKFKDDSDWIKLNAGQFGLYRVNYPKSIWDRLSAAAATAPADNAAPAISAVDLAGLLDDSWALAQAKETSIVHFLDLTRALAGRRTPEYAPWSVASDSIIRVRRLLQLQNPVCADRWAAFVRANVTTAFLAANSQLSLNASLANASDVQPDIQPRLLRPLLLGLAAEFDDPLVKQQALAMFADTSTQALKEDVDIRGTVYAIVAGTGQRSDYDAIKQIYLRAMDPNEISRSLAALAYATTPELTNATLEFSLSPEVRSQDTSSLITRVAFRGGASLQASWNFVRGRYNDISKKLGGREEAASSMGKLLRSVASGLASESAHLEIDTIFDEHKDVLTEPRFREGAKEEVKANIDWLDRNGDDACDWLSQQ